MEFMQIPWSQNIEADEVSKLASSEGREIITDLAIEVQKHPNIEEIATFTIQSTGN